MKRLSKLSKDIRSVKYLLVVWMIGGSSPGRGWEFLFSPPLPDRLWDPPSLLSNGYQWLFPFG
jgi:hypothetical protein